MTLSVCHVTSELAPLAKSGGLADMVGALTAHLARAGHDVRVFLPRYGHMDLAGREVHPVEFLQDLELPLGARQVTDLITLSGAAVQVPASATATMVTGVNISVAGGEYSVSGQPFTSAPGTVCIFCSTSPSSWSSSPGWRATPARPTSC